jgi:hypothetical protein
MVKNFYIIFSVSFLTACTSPNEIATTEAVSLGMTRPITEDIEKGLIINKRSLKNGIEEYLVRRKDGSEITVRVEMPFSYNIGDNIVLP